MRVVHSQEYLDDAQDAEGEPPEGDDGDEYVALLLVLCDRTREGARRPLVGRDGALNEPHHPEDEAAAKLVVQATEARGCVAQTDKCGEGNP